MNFFDKLQNAMDKVLSPIAKKMNESKTIKALSSGMLATMPVSLGVAAICVAVSLPIPGWTDFVSNSGLAMAGNEIMMVTISAMAIYLVLNVPYQYAKNENENGMTCATISMGVFLMMMPVFLQGEGYFLTAIETKYIGSDGVFVGMVLSIVVAKMYCYLCKKNLKLKLPDSVPPNVSDSLSPIFVSMIIFTTFFAIKYAISLTSYGNIFNLFNTLITKPIMVFGGTPASLIAVYVFASIMWFFGIHPSPILSTYGVVSTVCNTANIAAFTSGNSLPYFAYAITNLCLYFSATGNTLGLTLCMQKAKSERYKAMKAISLVPNLFNINEPVIFGVPVMLNPIFLIPMILCTLIPGLLGYAISSIFTFVLNPTIQMPWVTPSFITAFMQGGLPFFLIIFGCIILTTIIWYPFFKIADNNALKEEQKAEEGVAINE